MAPTTRYIRRDARIYQFSLCMLCGAAGGCGPKGCTTTTCLWCGTPQCSSNGLGRGQCAVCDHGLLPGWSGSSYAPGQCGYKGCQGDVVGRFPRKGACCATHGAKILGADYLPQALAARDKAWIAVDLAERIVGR